MGHRFFLSSSTSTTSTTSTHPDKQSQLTSFADLSPAIADARFVGPSAEKKARVALASTILPRLAMHEGLPSSLVKPLLALWHKGRPGGGGGHSSSSAATIASLDAKTSRLALSIAGLLLGPGEAGTPTPLPGAAPPSAATDTSASEALRASLAQVPGLNSGAPAAGASDPSPGLTEGALRLLAAAARGGNSGGGSGGAAAAAAAVNSSNNASSSSPSKWDADFVSALGVALARGEAQAAAFLDANGEAGAVALAALAAAAAEAAMEGGASEGVGGGASSSSSTSSKILGALTSSSSAAKKRAAAAAAAVADSSDALHGALAAARASLKGRALRDAALRASAGAGSADPLCARHALALMAMVARGDPARAARAFGLISGGERRSSRKASSSSVSASSSSSFDLAAAAATALASYETSALVLGAAMGLPSAASASAAPSSSSSSALSSAPSPTPGLNLDDPLARVNAARLLGAMLFAGIGGGSAAAAVSYASQEGSNGGGGGGGAPLFALLSALATRDADDMVALEACKAIAGWSGVVSNAVNSSSAGASSSSFYSNSNNSSPDEASTRDAAARVRAFAVLCARMGDATDFFVPMGLEVADEASSGLLAALCSRVRGALGSGNAPLVCAGARAAGALAEAAVRGYGAAVGGGLGLGGGYGGGSSNNERRADAAVAAIASLAVPLAGVTSSSSPAEAELALEALLWMQAMPTPSSNSSPLVLLDAGKVFALAGCLSESLATAALAAARRVLAAVAPRALAPSVGGGASGSTASPLPTALERTLLASTALVAGNPSRSRGEASLPELWATAARLGGWRGRATAALAALAVLEAPCPVLLASASSSSSESHADLAASVADDLAWSGVQQSAAWWLGEHGNAASGEVVGGGAVIDGAGGATATMTTNASASSGALSSAPISAALSLASGRCVWFVFVCGFGWKEKTTFSNLIFPFV